MRVAKLEFVGWCVNEENETKNVSSDNIDKTFVVPKLFPDRIDFLIRSPLFLKKRREKNEEQTI